METEEAASIVNAFARAGMTLDPAEVADNWTGWMVHAAAEWLRSHRKVMHLPLDDPDRQEAIRMRPNFIPPTKEEIEADEMSAEIDRLELRNAGLHLIAAHHAMDEARRLHKLACDRFSAALQPVQSRRGHPIMPCIFGEHVINWSHAVGRRPELIVESCHFVTLQPDAAAGGEF